MYERVETTVQWLVEVSLLIQSDVEKRLKHAHADQTLQVSNPAVAIKVSMSVAEIAPAQINLENNYNV